MNKFDRSIRGYNIEQVNAFVDDCVVKVDDMITRMKEKDLEIDKLKKEIEYYKELNEGLTLNNKINTNYYEEPQKESDVIINKAKDNASKIVNDALIKAEKIDEESQRLRRNIILYKERINNLMEKQMKIVDELDKVDLNDTNN